MNLNLNQILTGVLIFVAGTVAVTQLKKVSAVRRLLS